MVDLPFSTQKRLAVLDLRNRLERIAIQQFEASCDQGSLGYDNKIRNRLSFVLVTCREKAGAAELHGLVRLGRHVYARTSDVLHGRSSMVNVPDVMLGEWTTTVETLEQLVAS